MRFLQLVNFELSSSCPFAADHQEFCPAFKMLRGVQMDDQLIIDTAVALYKETEFTGLIGFHYYNEPWAERERMQKIVLEIIRLVPAARFLLWTNLAMHIEPQPETDSLLPLFEQVHVTIYKDLGKEFSLEVEAAAALRHMASRCPNIFIHHQRDDDRLHPQMPKPGPCFLPFLEMTFDSSGRVRPCCYDWKGEINIGNIRDGVKEVVRKWTYFRSNLSVTPYGSAMMGHMAPERCKVCGHRNTNLCSIDGHIASRTLKAIQDGEVQP